MIREFFPDYFVAAVLVKIRKNGSNFRGFRFFRPKSDGFLSIYLNTFDAKNDVKSKISKPFWNKLFWD